MTEFSKVFEKYIEEKKIQIPALGKYCGMDYKEIFRILKGKGELPDEDILQKIMSYMQLTPSEKRNILKVYEITRIGKEKYYMHRQVQTLLEEFPEYFYADRKSDILKISTEPPNENNRNCIPLFNQTEINQYLHYICIREARKQKNSRICLIMQPDHKFAMELLQSLKTINEDLVIEHVISIDKTEKISENVEFYNLRYLKNLLPLYINAMNYNVYCMEGNLQSYGEELPGFSNIFLTEDYVLVCTADFGRGILYNSPETKEYFRKRYNSFRDQSRELFHVVANVQNQMESLGDMGWDKRLSYAIQPEPCLLSLMPPELTEAVVYQKLPERAFLLPRFQAFIENAHTRIQKGLSYFYCTKEGLDHFAKEGRLPEAPEEVYRPFLPEERILLMNKALPLCRKGYFRFLKCPLDHLTANLHLCVNEKEGYLLFQNIHGENIYLIIHDKKLLWTFWDFLSSLDDKILYTGEETAAYFEKVIAELQDKMKNDMCCCD